HDPGPSGGRGGVYQGALALPPRGGPRKRGQSGGRRRSAGLHQLQQSVRGDSSRLRALGGLCRPGDPAPVRRRSALALHTPADGWRPAVRPDPEAERPSGGQPGDRRRRRDGVREHRRACAEQLWPLSTGDGLGARGLRRGVDDRRPATAARPSKDPRPLRHDRGRWRHDGRASARRLCGDVLPHRFGALDRHGLRLFADHHAGRSGASTVLDLARPPLAVRRPVRPVPRLLADRLSGRGARLRRGGSPRGLPCARGPLRGGCGSRARGLAPLRP
ncbi:hypothetical protein LTR94_029154, partial [Friedmanniomyces endolithicus]